MRQPSPPYFHPGRSARQERIQLDAQVIALSELVVLHDELATRLELVREAADDTALRARVHELAMREFSDCQRATTDAARSLRERLLCLSRHPRLGDPLLASGDVAEALDDAAAQVSQVADAAGALAGMGASIHPLELAQKAAAALVAAEQASKA